MAPEPPKRPRQQLSQATVFSDLPDHALEIVLSALPLEDRCRACTVNRDLKGVAYGSPLLWGPCCVVKPMDMLAAETHSLMTRGGGKLLTVKIEMYTSGGAGEATNAAILYDTGQRDEWDLALQSVPDNKKLETIEISLTVPQEMRHRLTSDGPRRESFERCVTTAMDALCAIADKLPLSLKKISIVDLGYNGMRKIVLKRHVRALEAAPCCTEGKCELNLVTCPLEECGNVQPRGGCCVCKEPMRCFGCAAREGGYQVIECDECHKMRCSKQECRDALGFLHCQSCDKDTCDDCMAICINCDDDDTYSM